MYVLKKNLHHAVTDFVAFCRTVELHTAANEFYNIRGHLCSNFNVFSNPFMLIYRGADKSLARPTSRCILFDCENISFDASLVVYINSTNIPPIMDVNRIYQNQNLLSL